MASLATTEKIYEQIGERMTKISKYISFRLNVQLGLSRNQKDRAYRSLAEHYQTKPTWTSERQQPLHLLYSCAV